VIGASRVIGRPVGAGLLEADEKDCRLVAIGGSGLIVKFEGEFGEASPLAAADWLVVAEVVGLHGWISLMAGRVP
jgi:hypothetical protein